MIINDNKLMIGYIILFENSAIIVRLSSLIFYFIYSPTKYSGQQLIGIAYYII